MVEIKNTILVVDDDASVRKMLRTCLIRKNYSVRCEAGYAEAEACIRDGEFALMFIDIKLGKASGIDLLRQALEHQPNCPVVLMTGYPDIDSSSEAVRLGAFDYLHKPFSMKSVADILQRGLKQKELLNERKGFRLLTDAVFRSVKDVILTVDSEYRILHVSRSAFQVCRFDPNVVGCNFRELPKECNERCFKALRGALETSRDVVLDAFECPNPNNALSRVSLVTSPLRDEKGKTSGVVMVVRDETRLADLERDLRCRQQFYNLVGKNTKMQQVYEFIESVADYRTTVLITGETGTGKELVCDALYHKSCQKSGPLVKVNCSALSENLIESELFGHVKGAFTGADRNKIGRFEMADGGTLFLDEIGEVSPHIQVKLLRTLQEKSIERVGDGCTREVDVRVVAATSEDLTDKVQKKEFKESLYYRLKVVEIKLPPLREKMDDVPLLIEYFTEQFNRQFRKTIREVSREVLRLFMSYHWPGNVRELKNIIEHACILCRHDRLIVDDLPQDFINRGRGRKKTAVCEPNDERDEILKVLVQNRWNKSRAADALGISRRTLYRRMNKHEISNL